jgi:hypothetical protein
MGQSLFQRKTEPAKGPLTPIQLIEQEIDHLKKGTSVRHGKKTKRMAASSWILALVLFGVALLYFLDPIEHAWYRYDAIRAYLYLHSYGAGRDANELANCGILRTEEVGQLDNMHANYQDYYDSPQAAARTAQAVVTYMTQVKELHAGHYAQLDWLEKIRYVLFVRPGLVPPKAWDSLDPGLQ